MRKLDLLLQTAQDMFLRTPSRPTYLLLARLDLTVTELKDGT